MKPTFEIAATDAEFATIARLRYEIYVKEMRIFGAVAPSGSHGSSVD